VADTSSVLDLYAINVNDFYQLISSTVDDLYDLFLRVESRLTDLGMYDLTWEVIRELRLTPSYGVDGIHLRISEYTDMLVSKDKYYVVDMEYCTFEDEHAKYVIPYMEIGVTFLTPSLSTIRFTVVKPNGVGIRCFGYTSFWHKLVKGLGIVDVMRVIDVVKRRVSFDEKLKDVILFMHKFDFERVFYIYDILKEFRMPEVVKIREVNEYLKKRVKIGKMLLIFDWYYNDENVYITTYDTRFPEVYIEYLRGSIPEEEIDFRLLMEFYDLMLSVYTYYNLLYYKIYDIITK